MIGGSGRVAGLGDVDLVAVPVQLIALRRPPGIAVIRGGQPRSARRETVLSASRALITSRPVASVVTR